MIRFQPMRTIIAFGLTVLLLGGCALWGGGDAGREIDPPPEGANLLPDDEEVEPTMAAASEQMMDVTLYYKDPNGYVTPVSVEIPYTVSAARAVLEHMVEGGPGDALVPEGFTALLPKGTKIQGIDIMNDKLAVVDFSPEFASYNPQDERKIMEAVTWALTQYDTIDKVQFWLNGETLTEMPQDGTPMDEPLTRAMGINLELGEGIELSRSMPVTLYFQSQSEAGDTYFVPVTRMVSRSDDAAEAALQELIRGPISPGLVSVIVPTAKVLNVRHGDDLITVDFNTELLNGEDRAPAETLQSVVLSLTDTTGAEQVMITVDGSVQVVGTDDVAYSEPVGRPRHINKLES